MVAASQAQSTKSQKHLSIIGLEMSPEAAASHVSRIKDHLEKAEHHVGQARSLILDLFNGKGWAALGYKSWRQCVLAEFEKCSSMLYKELRAAQVEMELSTTGTNEPISERVLRPLTKKGYTAEARQAIWDIATTIVGAGGKVTSGVIEAVAAGLEEMLASGTTQGANGHQSAITEHMSADLTARVRETRIAHREHIRRMGAERTYIVGGRKVKSAVRATLNNQTIVEANFLLESDLELELMKEAMRSGKPIYISMWTEDTPNANG